MARQDRTTARGLDERSRGKLAEAVGPRSSSSSDDRMTRIWRSLFLAELAATSNVTAACSAAGVSSARAYNARREEPDFALAWRNALFEGYELLELETLCRLRNGEVRGEERKHDIANAIRLLKAHAETMASERARREDLDEHEVLESIDQMIDQMRERAAANTALLSEDIDDEA